MHRVFKIVLCLSCFTILTTCWFLFQAHKALDVSDVSNRRYKMVVAIRTAMRRHPTVLGVATRLAAAPNFHDYKMVVWQSYSSANDEDTRRTLENLGATVFTQKTVYPELSNDKHIKITWGDPLPQVKWRTNHVLDFANTLERCLTYKTDFILMLEDDMYPAKNCLDKVYRTLQNDIPIRSDRLGYVAFFSFNPHIARRGMVDISKRLGAEGACALAFHHSLVPKLIKRLRSQPYENPVDIAFWLYIGKQLNLSIYERVPNLFQHIPMESTLIRPVQPSKAPRDREERSMTFVYDEDNLTLLLHPSDPSGYIGCFKDADLFYDLSGSWIIPPSNSNMLEECKSFCGNRVYLFLGVQLLNDSRIICRCGNEFGIYGEAQERDCVHLAGGERCGRHLTNAVYRVEAFNATYLGCHRDNRTNRDLKHYIGLFNKPTTCSSACSNYRYFGLQFGGECFCGDSYGLYGRVKEVNCSMPCRANSKFNCGGSLANSAINFLVSYLACGIVSASQVFHATIICGVLDLTGEEE